LVRECGGVSETLRYLESCRTGKSYNPSDVMLSRLREGMYVSVVGSQRIRTTIPAVYKTCGRLLSCATALTYAGALDHRARTGGSGDTIIWSEESPLTESRIIEEILDIPAETLETFI